MRSTPLIAPSVLSADFSKFGEEIRAVEAAGADWIHVDAMDGHFVPNLTFGPQLCRAIRPHVKTVLDVHLMISPVDAFLEEFSNAGADVLTVHAEAGPHLDRSLQHIRDLGCKVGVALNPSTPVESIIHVMDRIDLVCVMTVNPGFGGQSFIETLVSKVEKLRDLIAERPIHIEIDGGVSPKTARMIVEAGADVLVAGSAVFNSKGPSDTELYRKNIENIRAAAGQLVGRNVTAL